MANIARQSFFSIAKVANRHFTSPTSAIRVSARALSSKSVSSSKNNNNEKDVSLSSSNNNNNNQSMQEAQGIQAESPLPDFSVGNGEGQYDWSRSFFGLSTQAFPREAADILQSQIVPQDIEIKPGAYSNHKQNLTFEWYW